MSQNKRPASPTDSAKDEDERQYGAGPLTLEELEEKYPNRPRNHSKTLLFSELYRSLFNPLNENKAQPSGPRVARKKVGPHGPSKLSPHEQRRAIIQRFISRWRAEVGSDFYPALRLILPDKDRDRGVYGLKENTIGKLLVKLMKIDKNSEDGYNLLHWKLPGQTTASRMAGDFAGRCFEVLSKRQMRTEPGNMRIAEVNELLDKLAGASGEAEQLPIFDIFYKRMNAEELMWLIRIVLKQMKVGATERTFLDLWHHDGEALFSVSSSLRRVCWELHDPEFRLEEDESGINLMQCFQPQLAQFQMPESFQKMVTHLGATEENPEFWIEEKLDGERMQMHMMEDEETPGGVKFCFWSRKAKDYTYLYGNGFEDDNSALTRHLKEAFSDRTKNCILDGEMITWDPKTDKIVPFGTLKTAALSGQKNPFDDSSERPVYRVFDILYLNDKPLTKYTLRDRHRALETAVPGVPGRLEIHPHIAATSPDAIEPQLRKIVAEASEGLVLKNPKSMYRLNSRNNDWIKVKPEYMSEFGESLDCVVIGGYFGSGRRGGNLSSFLCGLRASENYIKAGVNPEKCWSFFKVGGGFKAEDYAEIRHRTEGKWIDWDANNPPSEYVELGGGEKLQYERPDVWIRPKDSIVISVKAASIGQSDSFAIGETLRFPRFRRLRLDRSWDSALDIDQLHALKSRVDQEAQEKKNMEIEDRRSRRSTKRVKRETVIAGQTRSGGADGNGQPRTQVFEGMTFLVLSEALKPIRKTRDELVALVKENGGQAVLEEKQNVDSLIVVADKKVVKAAAIIKRGERDVIKPKWIIDSINQGYPLPFEKGHLFWATDAMAKIAENNTDQYGDSYARDAEVEELREILANMPKLDLGEGNFDKETFLTELEEHGHELPNLKGWTFRRCRIFFAVSEDVWDVTVMMLRNYVQFGSATVAETLDDESITHVVVVARDETAKRELAADVRYQISSRKSVPRVVTDKWVMDCWEASTLVDEEQYAPL
ncbi:putative dna ligase 4 protein [Phaeoacremonium minimum UCRPA7]|uniref:DNA ligase n=1 Tax=Phaeoacremonium minimum (strain UCR-PA7) TaxID=1286976 RepID=R8BCR9_PHAM7|nr:putative dna ligase 4 protein [Phaeoacremonium minimum UCRPA7]EON97104.1 putative dna ligase 4 protein [Phaeoacremonium minimum UCRPA7]